MTTPADNGISFHSPGALGAGYTSGRTRSGGTERTYFSPAATVNVTDAIQVPSGHRDQPSQKPRYQRPSCSTSTGRGSSYQRTSLSATPATVGAR